MATSRRLVGAAAAAGVSSGVSSNLTFADSSTTVPPLRDVVVVFRHGARSPVHRMDGYPAMPALVCTAQANASLPQVILHTHHFCRRRRRRRRLHRHHCHDRNTAPPPPSIPWPPSLNTTQVKTGPLTGTGPAPALHPRIAKQREAIVEGGGNCFTGQVS